MSREDVLSAAMATPNMPVEQESEPHQVSEPLVPVTPLSPAIKIQISPTCCGLLELSGIANYKDGPASILANVKDRLLNVVYKDVDGDERNYAHAYGRRDHPEVIRMRKPFVLFSGVVTCRGGYHNEQAGINYGQNLADYITEKGLGRVVGSPVRRNWTSNDIAVWIWAPNYAALEAWQPKGEVING